MRNWFKRPGRVGVLIVAVLGLALAVPVAATAQGVHVGVPAVVTTLAAAAPAGASAPVTWGSNDAGQLGDVQAPGMTAEPMPVAQTGAVAGKIVSSVSSGSAHTCEVADGHAFCWGLNADGQLGNGTTADSPSPVAVTTSDALSNKIVTAVSAGSAHSCAIAGGAVYCWGSGADGVLGNGGTADSPTPVAVSGALAGKTVTSVSAGASSTCAVADGRAYCWGYNGSGQLGTGTTTDSAVPVPVDVSAALARKIVTAVSVGASPASSTCAIADAAAYCWGANTAGQLGDGSTTQRLTPVAVDTGGALGNRAITAIATGGYSTCAVAGGSAYCWGSNEFGELGDKSTTARSAPVPVDATGVLAGKVVTAISTKGLSTGNAAHPVLGHSCAVASGQVFCWGANQYGQLGAATSSYQSSVPVAISTTGALQSKSVTTVSLGELFSSTLTSPAPASTAGGVVSLPPTRIMDTRVNQGATGPVGSGTSISLQVTGKGGVPTTGASAVVVNITAVAPTTAGYLTVWPSGQPRPSASNLNFQAKQTTPNLVLVPIGPDGKIQLYNGSPGTVQLLADITGYIVAGAPTMPGAVAPLPPTRIMDTRVNQGATGPVGSGTSISLQVTGKGGVPTTGASAVVVNITAVAPTTAGYLTVWPSGQPRPSASNLNFQAKQTTPNLVLVPIGPDGKIQLYNGSLGTVQLLADITGYIVGR